jgi:two-component system CheB/CheR fusion protein
LQAAAQERLGCHGTRLPVSAESRDTHLAKGLTAIHGGRVSAKIEASNRATEITGPLPLAPSSDLAVTDSRASTHPRRVLIIDDNRDTAESLKEVLALDSHVVETALSGPEGLTKACHFKPEVVLCDIGLPDMDGYAVARAFRVDPALRSAFLVALSGYADPDDLLEAQAAGFDRHLAKPSSIAAVHELIRGAGVAPLPRSER